MKRIIFKKEDLTQLPIPEVGYKTLAINLDGTLSYIDDLGDITPIIGTNSGGITNLVDDTTPELGGNLDVQSNEIISTSPNDIKLNSSEDIVLELGDFNGDNKVSILNSNSLEVASIDSYGNISTTGTINGRDLSTDGSKLDNIESGADVTDSTNVDAAGAVMNTDVTTASMSFVIDEDNMISNSDTKIPTQQSVKAYVDNRVASSVTYQGGYNATTSPNSSALKGYMYTVTVAGTASGYWSSSLEIGDVIIAEIDNPSSQTDWTVVNKDLNAASIKTSYESNSDTNAFTDVEKTKLAGIEANATADQTASEILTAIKTVDGTGSGLDADLLDGQEGSFYQAASTAITKTSAVFSKTITIESPTASEDITVFRTDVAITVQEVIAVSNGTSPSTTYVLRHSTDRNAVGNLLTTSGTTTSTTTGNIATLSDNTIPVDSWIWLETTAASGTNVKLTIDIRYTID